MLPSTFFLYSLTWGKSNCVLVFELCSRVKDWYVSVQFYPDLDCKDKRPNIILMNLIISPTTHTHTRSMKSWNSPANCQLLHYSQYKFMNKELWPFKAKKYFRVMWNTAKVGLTMLIKSPQKNIIMMFSRHSWDNLFCYGRAGITVPQTMAMVVMM